MLRCSRGKNLIRNRLNFIFLNFWRLGLILKNWVLIEFGVVNLGPKLGDCVKILILCSIGCFLVGVGFKQFKG